MAEKKRTASVTEVPTVRVHRAERSHSEVVLSLGVPKHHQNGIDRRNRISTENLQVSVIAEEQEADFSNAPRKHDSIRSSHSNASSRLHKTNLQLATRTNGGGGVSGYVNRGYRNSTGTGSLSQGINGSTTGSVPSVHHEQYCCWNRWTKLERKLFWAVTILGCAVVLLVITVGILGDRRNK